jgi:hypothetical protein
MTAMTMPATAPEETPDAGATLEATAVAEEVAITDATPPIVDTLEVARGLVDVDSTNPVARTNVVFAVSVLIRDVVPAFVLVLVATKSVSQINSLVTRKGKYEQQKIYLPETDLMARR